MVKLWQAIKESIIVYFGILIALTPIIVRVVSLLYKSQIVYLPYLLQNGELFLLAIGQLYCILIETKQKLFRGLGIVFFVICMTFYTVGTLTPNANIEMIYYSSMAFILIVAVMIIYQKYTEIESSDVVQSRQDERDNLEIKVIGLQGESK